MKLAVIIDSYPSSEEQQQRLLHNLGKIKSTGMDVLVSSHHPCNSSIIEVTDYFLYEKSNRYYYLDSDILNYNLAGIENPVYLKYLEVGGRMFYDRLVITGWSEAITSNFFNSIRFLWNKGYEYAFFLHDDFICPDDFSVKIQNILQKSQGHRNYFIRNSPNFSSWFAPFLFGFQIDELLIQKLPQTDLSLNSNFQKFFPNCCFEDVLLRIWGDDTNFIDDFFELDLIFGENNWDLVNSVYGTGSSRLHSEISSSVYVNLDQSNSQFCLMLNVPLDCFCERVNFDFEFRDQDGNLLKEIKLDLHRTSWYTEFIDEIFTNQRVVIMRKKIQGFCGDEIYSFEDAITFNNFQLKNYSELKSFE